MRERGLKLGRSSIRSFELTSLPMRERGLKLKQHDELIEKALSLPMRERGLKRGVLGVFRELGLSLPMRERGLKRRRPRASHPALTVAPHAGAWIETAGQRLHHGILSGRSPCGSVD